MCLTSLPNMCLTSLPNCPAKLPKSTNTNVSYEPTYFSEIFISLKFTKMKTMGKNNYSLLANNTLIHLSFMSYRELKEYSSQDISIPDIQTKIIVQILTILTCVLSERIDIRCVSITLPLFYFVRGGYYSVSIVFLYHMHHPRGRGRD